MSFLAGLLAFLLSVPGPTAPHCDGLSRCSDGKQVERSVGNFNRNHDHPGNGGGDPPGGGNPPGGGDPPDEDDGNNGHGNDDDHDDDSNPGQGHGNHGNKKDK